MRIIENMARYSSYRTKCVIALMIVLLVTIVLLRILLRDSRKRFVQFVLIILACTMVGVGAIGIAVENCSKYIETEEKYTNLVKRDILSIIPGIVCWGDSLTAGADGDFEPYPSLLSRLLVEEYTGKCIDDSVIPDVNMGVGGEDSINIVGRSGNIPFTLNAFEIDAEVKPVEISFLPIDGKKVSIGKNGSFNGVNPCTINGIEGDISLVDGRYYFTRLETGEPSVVDEGTELVTYASGKWKDYITIIYMGANGGYDDIEDLIHQQHAIIDNLDEGNDRYLVITTTGDDRAANKSVEDAMVKEYGDKYLKLRDYLCSDAINDMGLFPSDQDLIEMEQGIVPSSLRQDSIHYNENGTKAVARCVFGKLRALGYFDELESYISNIVE